MMSFINHTRDGQRQPAATPSLLAACIAMALMPTVTFAAPTEETVIVDGSAGTDATVDEKQDYSVKITSAGTKMQMVQRDIPQSVTIVSEQRMEDQQLQTLGDVMDNTMGISKNSADSERASYYSRGFEIDNYMIDGIPTYFESRWNMGDAQSDTALYERVEVVRGATGLMTGTGNPSAAINMVRKHATSREFTGNVSAEYGSWNKQRYVMDMQSPLTADGNVRGRIVAGYQDSDSWLDRYNQKKTFFSGIVDADLGDSTSLSAGYEYQRIDTNDQTWGGLPRWNTDGSLNHYDRAHSTAPEWAYNDKEFNKFYAALKQRFAQNWQATLNATHTQAKFDSKAMYLDAYVDKSTGMLVGPYASYGPGYDYVGGTGWNSGTRKVDAVDLFADGGYELFGRQHTAMIGGSYSRQTNRYINTWANVYPDEFGSFYDYEDGRFPETNWGQQLVAQDDKTYMKSLYAATRLTLADPLHLILGARYTNWRVDTMSYGMEKNHTTPYAGLVYDIDDNWSAYASYTSIFQPQNYRDSSGRYLTPVTGNNYEAGLKSDWMNSRLTTTLSVFRIEQDNVGQSTGRVIAGSTDIAYEEVDGTVSRGVEFELNGALTDNWQMTFGATRYIADDSDGNAVNPYLPRTSIKLFTRYRLPAMPALTVGGGVNWQNRVYSDVVTPYGTWRAEQGSYALVDLFTRYEVTKNFSLQGNINNLFDKAYDTNVQGSLVYGEPRSVSVTASYQF